MIGGSPRISPVRRSAGVSASTTAPADHATGSGTRRGVGSSPAARQTRSTISATGLGSPLETTRARPDTSAARSNAATMASAALST